MLDWAMAQSLSENLVHIVFSTRAREPLLADAWREEFHTYVGGIVRHHRRALLAAGSVEDHVHLLVRMPRDLTIATMVKWIKVGSGEWIRKQGPEQKEFRWQGGYGAFSVSCSLRGQVESYLARQRQHHQKHSFQDELRRLLRAHEIAFDERYLWD